ncbi:MAG: DUF1289 domain-containing protein [Candidatus Marinimicrobia bacterium]|nr:DUF1289 domain-containing protein [Candidatus Neomarinimicrobiota bacterium]|tara:strand:+ start:4874 stop:5146 length:273 start_codon:yes stop_codon:yes gene_type:complete
MNNEKIISPCISICKNDPITGFCFGCARSDEEKKIWKKIDTKNEWKKENLQILLKRMSQTQLKTFKRSYEEKLKFGKLVYSKKSEKKPQN